MVYFNNVSIVTSPERLQTGTREAIALAVTEQVVSLAQAALDARGMFTMATAGGSVAEACLPLIANATLPWSLVHIFWCDERAVPRGSHESNAGKAAVLWKGSRLAAEAQLHVMPGHLPGLESAAVSYAAELTAFAGDPAILDVVLLGVGDDGHVASLFPHHRELSMTGSSVLAVSDSPKPPKRRLSLSMDTLTGARDTFVVALGAGKAQVMRQALESPNSQLPVSQVIRRAQRVHVLLDTDAASALANKSR